MGTFKGKRAHFSTKEEKCLNIRARTNTTHAYAAYLDTCPLYKWYVLMLMGMAMVFQVFQLPFKHIRSNRNRYSKCY